VFSVGLLNVKESCGLSFWYANSYVGHNWSLVIAASNGRVARQLSDIQERDIGRGRAPKSDMDAL